MNEQAKEQLAAYRANIEAIVESGGYKNTGIAAGYIHGKLKDVWWSVLDLESDDVPLPDQLGMTPTMQLLLHFFARSVHKFGLQRSKLPTLVHECPSVHAQTGAPILLPAVSKRDLSRIIGKSQSSIENAISRFRHKTEVLFEKQLVYPLFVDKGIMFDVCTNLNMMLPFDVNVYTYAKSYSLEQRLSMAPTYQRQGQWCTNGILAKSGKPVAEAVPANDMARNTGT